MCFFNISKVLWLLEMLSLYSKMFASILYIIVVILITAIVISVGCATFESDLPWNTPQSWEGTITVPGMENLTR